MNNITQNLTDRILKYMYTTNTFGRPQTDEDIQLFNQVVGTDKPLNESALNLTEIIKVARAFKSEEIQAGVDFYVECAKQMGIEVTGYTENIDETSSIDVQLNFDRDKESGKYKTAYGKFDTLTQTINVLKDSDARVDYKDTLPHVKSNRLKYGIYIEDGKVTRNIDALTPSAAAVFILGNSANGWIDWVDSEGKSIDKYRKQGLDENSIVRPILRDERDRADMTIKSEDKGMQTNNLTPMELLAKGFEAMLKQNRTIEIGEGTKKFAQQLLADFLNTRNKVTIDSTEDEMESIIDSEEDYTEDDLKKDIIGDPQIELILRLNNQCQNILYRGVPGCGKTFIANCIAKFIIGKRSSNRIKQIDFNTYMTYSDTMTGMKQGKEGLWKEIRGQIIKFCDFALKHPDVPFVLILNEFTRADAEAILGQLFTAMENRYRGKRFYLNNGEVFICPKNLMIIATMNGTDRGVKNLDKATKERFYIIDVEPMWKELNENEMLLNNFIFKLGLKLNTKEYTIIKNIVKEMADTNEKIVQEEMLGADYQIGQRQLLQFYKNTDKDGKEYVYDEGTLKTAIETLIQRMKDMVNVFPEIQVNIDNLNEILKGIA